VEKNSDYPLILSGLEIDDIGRLTEGEPPYRARQIFGWIHRGIEDFEGMSNIPVHLRQRLAGISLLRNTVIDEAVSGNDGTVKYRIGLNDGYAIESVILTDSQQRRTACLSTQAGCAMGCTFCRTGSMGLKRNLAASEIVEQYHHLLYKGGKISNIVFMGMGEPLANTKELYKAIRILTHPDGPALSPRRITVSTCGIAPQIPELARETPGVRLAVSLPSAHGEKRNQIMPGASTCPPEELKSALSEYQKLSGNRITIETVLFGGVNTGTADALDLVSFTRGLKVIINLIPFNPFEGSLFTEPSLEEVETYTSILTEHGLKVTRRFRRGRGILGACGQLAT